LDFAFVFIVSFFPENRTSYYQNTGPLFSSTVVFGIITQDAGSPSFPHPMLNFGKRKYLKMFGEMPKSNQISDGSGGESWLFGSAKPKVGRTLKSSAAFSSWRNRRTAGAPIVTGIIMFTEVK